MCAGAEFREDTKITEYLVLLKFRKDQKIFL